LSKAAKDTANLPVDPQFLMMLFLIVALLFGWKLPIPIPFPAWMYLVGWAIILCGLGLGFSALMAMKKSGTSPNPSTPTNEIVMSGPYRFSRNPIYLGYVAVVIALPLIFGTYWGVALVTFAIDAYNRFAIDREEAYLKRKFGEKYLNYMAKVRRWL